MKFQYCYDLLCTLADNTRKRGSHKSWIPGLDWVLMQMWYRLSVD